MRWLVRLFRRPEVENGDRAERRAELEAARQRQLEVEARAAAVRMQLDVLGRRRDP